MLLLYVPIGEESADDADRLGAEVALGGKVKMLLVVHDLAVGADERVGVEGRVADEHLVQEDAHRPPVALAAIDAVAALRLEDFGRYVVGRANGRVRAHQAVLVHLDARAEVGELQVTVSIDEHVVGLFGNALVVELLSERLMDRGK